MPTSHETTTSGRHGVVTRGAKRALEAEAATRPASAGGTNKTPGKGVLTSPLLDNYFQPRKVQRMSSRAASKSESLRSVRQRGGTRREVPLLSGHFATLPQVFFRGYLWEGPGPVRGGGAGCSRGEPGMWRSARNCLMACCANLRPFALEPNG